MKTKQSKELARTGSWLRSLSLYKRGQMMVILGLALGTLAGVVALGADIGVLYYNWVKLQKAADAAALAGAGYLPNDATTAASTAKAYATDNGTSTSDTVTATPINSDTQMQVTITRTVPYSFARALGLTDGYVKVSAIASIPPAVTTVNAGPGGTVSCNGSACTSGGTTVTAGSGASGSGTPYSGSCGSSGTGEYNVLPIALDDQTTWVSGQTTVLNQVDASGKKGGWPDAPGNWGYISVCGGNPSGSLLRTNMADGYGGELSVGNVIQSVPGEKTGPVQMGLTDRLGTGGTLSAAPASFNASDPRAVVIPIVSFASCTGTCDLTIEGFMAVYILGVNGGAITVQDIGLVIPNSVGSTTALNDGAMGDIVLVH